MAPSLVFLLPLLLLQATQGFVPLSLVPAVHRVPSAPSHPHAAPSHAAPSHLASTSTTFVPGPLIEKSKEMRLKHLEEQALYALETCVNSFENPVFPNALIAGDVVITHLLSRLDYLKNEKVKVMVVDTFHLFDSSLEFLEEIEGHYGFKSHVFQAVGIERGDKAGYDKRYGKNLWKEDIEQYDKVCKVEPFGRGLKELNTDCMINGRTRWQGNERAWIDQFESAPINGGLAKCNPLAYWTLEDTFDYIAKYNIPHHPLHASGYPSIGDEKDTVPIPRDGSVRFVNGKFEGNKAEWLDYACERKGRFVGLENKDGTTKTECGIHVEGAEKTFDRDLWDENTKVVKVTSQKDAEKIKSSGKKSVFVVYAPWCKFCKAMESSLSSFASSSSTPVYAYRGDEDREFVQSNFNTETFPTINAVKADGTVVKYQSEDRSAEAIQKWIDGI